MYFVNKILLNKVVKDKCNDINKENYIF